MIGRWIRRLRGEPLSDSIPEGKGVPIEELAQKQMPHRWGPHFLLKHLGTTGAGEIFIGKQAKAEPVAAQSWSVEETVNDLLIIRRGLVPMDSSPYLQLRLSEMNIYQQLTHPQVCPLVEAGECEGAPVIVSKYTLGKSLLELLEHCRLQKRSLPWLVATFVAHEVCVILEYLHAKQNDECGNWNLILSSGGFSPADIFVDYSGQVRLANFGLRILTKNVDMLPEDWSVLDHTRVYYSPEAVAGKVLGQSADSFCMGWLLWEMVTGQKLFAGQSDFETLTNIRDVIVQPPTDLNPEVPRKVEEIIIKALSKNPSERHQRIGDMKRGLAENLDLDPAKSELAAMMNTIFCQDRDQAHDEIRRWARWRGRV